MRVLTGTSGYSYKEWKGSFYPEDLAADAMLAYYAERFPAVEINNTFYRMPTASVLRKWRDQVPEGFVFVLKASRRITHQQRLKNAADSLAYLIETSAVLGDHLGPFLFQLPPSQHADLERLTDFLALLPRDCRAAFEFRHPSWFDDPVYAALRAHGAALCIADIGGDSDLPRAATAGWGYLRLRREGYSPKELTSWAEFVHGQAWTEAYVFFKHEEAGTGPALATRFGELLSG